MDYKKLSEDARNLAACYNNAKNGLISDMIQSYADAIEDLLEQVEQMKNLHMKVQAGYEELSISELCNRLERMKKAKDDAVHDRMMAEQKFNELYKRAERAEKERDKAISDFHKAVKENGICSSCKHRFKECAGICMCDADGEDHWEWEGLNE